MSRTLFMIVLIFTVSYGHAAASETTRINFEVASNPLAVRGAVATDLYADQGIHFPSAPTISEIGLWPSQVLKQGDAWGGPGPLPTEVRCGRLVIRIEPSLRARHVELTVLTRHLRFYSVEAFNGDVSIDRYSFWPPRDFRGLELERTIVLDAEAGEADITQIVADPGDCFDLMAIDDLVIVGDGPRRDPAYSYVTAYEINQGVMPRLTLRPRPDVASTPDTRLAAVPRSSLQFVRGRTTVARFFLGSVGREIHSYEPRLSVMIVNEDGSRRTIEFRENTIQFTGPARGPLTVRVVDPSLPTAELTRILVVQRNSIDETADFVIPGAALENARLIDLQLFAPSGPRLAWVRAVLEGPFTMAFNLVRVRGTGAGTGIGGPVPTEPARTSFRRYFNAAFPVSDLPGMIALPVFSWGGPGSSPNDCGTLLSSLSGVYASPPPLPSANYQGIIFLASAAPGCGGLGWYNTPGALTVNQNDIAAHEVSHNLGINHASNLHGEPAAGGDWESWPYLHGSIGTPNQADPNQSFGVYGAIMKDIGREGSGPLGTWRLGIVAPCGTRDPARLFPSCTEVDGSMVHDYMSYGPTTMLPIHGSAKWISDINYHRVYRFLEDCTSLDPPNRFFSGATSSGVGGPACTPAGPGGSGMARTKTGEMPSVEALIISGVLVKDVLKSVTVLQRPAVADVLSRDSGDYELVLFGKDRQERRRIRFQPLPASPENSQESESTRLFRVVLPLEPDLESFTIQWQGKVLFKSEASAPPTATKPLLTSKEWKIGEKATVTWDAKDNDSQVLTALLLYSPDGLAWYPLALIDGRQGKFVVDTSELLPSEKARLYLSLSDGVNTVAAQSEIFAVRRER